jgi:uncharacterized protein YqfB (UPF0267 family)
MKSHYLKCWPMYFDEVQAGRKTFEIRSTSDRVFQAGDRLVLQAWNPASQMYLGTDHIVDVLAVYHDVPGLQPGHCLMSIRPAGSAN